MKRLFFLLLVVPAVGYNQKISVKVDKLTGDTMWVTSRETIYKTFSLSGENEKLDVAASKNKEFDFISFWGKTSKISLVIFKPGNNASLKLSNGEILHLMLEVGEVSSGDRYAKGEFWNTHYRLSPEAKQKLASYDVSMIRFEHSSGILDYEIKGKNGSAIKGAVAAIGQK